MSDDKYVIRPNDKLSHVVRVEGGKYTFYSYLGFIVDIARHGDDWLKNIDGPKAINQMMYELDAARVVLAAARSVIAMRGRTEIDFKEIMSAVEALVESVRKHDALVDDREPPSEWTK
jgi:gamma-glutamyltranspeptidase